MKRIEREDFKVHVTLSNPTLADLGFTGLGGTSERNVELVILPQRLGEIGAGMSFSDSMVSRDIEGDYERRCNDLLAEMRRQRRVLDGKVTWTETVTCSHCNLGWEELTAELLEQYPDWAEQPGDGPGLPLCCEPAQVEWRAAQTAVTA